MVLIDNLRKVNGRLLATSKGNDGGTIGMTDVKNLQSSGFKMFLANRKDHRGC
jgi:hypothetical protein